MSTVAAATDDFEIEAMSKEDSSWRPCQISLSSDTSSTFGLIVSFEGEDSNEVIITKDEALTRLRIRSVPLQGDDCSRIKKGEHVLASQKTEFKDLFFDAEVEKVSNIRHSKRNPCRCTFEIKWLKLHKVGTVTVPASSVMKLAQHSLDIHPTVSEFLNSVEPFDYSGLSSIVSLIEETVFETGLEKQMEEINRLADVSRKGSPDGCRLELKKDNSGQVRHRTLASQVTVVHDYKNSKRATRSQRKVAPPPPPLPPQPVSKEPDRLYLSPLGARAALASLMYKLPSDSELSANTVLLSKNNSTASLDTSSDFLDFDCHIQEVVSIKDTSNKSLRSRSRHNRLEKQVGLPTATRLTRSAKKGVGLANDEVELQSSPEERKFSPMQTSRLTRSIIQKEIEQSDDESEMNSSCEEMNLCSPTHSTRLTRSTIHNEIRNSPMEVKEGSRQRKLGQKTESKQTNQKEVVHTNDGAALKSSREDTKSPHTTHTPRFTRSTVHNEIRNVTLEVKKGQEKWKSTQGTEFEQINDGTASKSSYEETKSPSITHTPRSTRSAIHNEIRNGFLEVKKGSQKRKSDQDTDSNKTNENAVENLKDGTVSSYEETKSPKTTHTPRFTRSAIQKEVLSMTLEGLDSAGVDLVTPQTKVTKRKKPLSSPSDEEIKSSQYQERKKETVNKDMAGEISRASARHGEQKSVSSKKKPSLRVSPRTRSQNKSS